MLLDEPTNHLDIQHQLSLLQQVQALPVTTLVALHDLNQALTCDRLAVLDKGRLVALGKPAEVLTPERLLSTFGVHAHYLIDPFDGARILRFRTPEQEVPPMSRPLALLLASALLAPTALAESAQSQSNGWVEDGSWSLLNRGVFDQRDYKHGGRNSAARNAYKPRNERNGKAEEWAYGLMATLQSGFTQGLIGVGVDAHAYLGVQLDSGGGRAGKARLLAVDNAGHPKSDYSRAGAALKLRMSDTVLSYGEQRVKTPVFSASDSRLLPETVSGLLLTSSELDSLKLVAGHFTEDTDRNASSHDQGFVVNYSNGRQGNSFDLAGVVWDPVPLSAAACTAHATRTAGTSITWAAPSATPWMNAAASAWISTCTAPPTPARRCPGASTTPPGAWSRATTRGRTVSAWAGSRCMATRHSIT